LSINFQFNFWQIFLFFLIFEVSFYHSKMGSIGRRLIVAATFYKIQEV